jgi:hypothetical protein
MSRTPTRDIIYKKWVKVLFSDLSAGTEVNVDYAVKAPVSLVPGL